MDGDDGAWEHLYAQYRTLVAYWVHCSGALASSGESTEFFVTAAFIRFWKAVTPERFPLFTGLSALLGYLRKCAISAVIESTRVQTRGEVLPEEATAHDGPLQRSAEEEALERVSHAELWLYITSQLRNQAECVVFLESFVHGMKAKDVFTRHPDLFVNINAVYTVRHTIRVRLCQDEYLRRLLRS